MAKRLTDSEKWKDAWFMDLPSKYKLFWLYLLDNCDHAGIWRVNFKVASFHIGEHLEHSEVKRILSDRIKIVSDEYWMINKFIDFQYGGIKNDAVGKSVQKILNKHNLIGAMEGLCSPYEGTKDKDKDKDAINVFGLENNPDGLYIIVKDNLIAIKIHQQSFEKYLEGTFGGAYEGQKMALRNIHPPIKDFFLKNNGNIYNDNNHLWHSFKKLWINEKPIKGRNPGKLQ
jgi:hypothetical protein